VPGSSPAVDRSAITVGAIDIRLPSKWIVYAANRPGRKVAEIETPSRVNLVPGEIYRFVARIQQKSDLLLLQELANIVPLRQLMLVNPTLNLGDECLAAIAGFSYLEKLLVGCLPSFQGVSHLKNLTSLKRIEFLLDKTHRVTDEAIMQLSSLTNLETLVLLDTSVTADGMNRLRQLLPNCKVTRELV
jgi:hypothetical protein